MFFHRRTASFAATAILWLHPAIAQRHERKEAEIEGSATFQTPLPFDKCFEAVLNTLKRDGHEIDIAGRDTGKIVTAMEIAGKYSQTGTRYHVVFIQDSETQTSVRVAVTVQKRKKLLQAEPWSDPKVDGAQSTSAAAGLQAALQAR